MPVIKISTILLLVFILGSNILSIKLSSKCTPDKDTCASGFFIATPGGYNGNWNTKLRFPFNENFTFQAIGNDIYLAVFEDDNPTPTDVLIISGYSNSKTLFFDNGTVQGEVCSVPMKIEDLTASNTFRVEFNVEKNSISLWYNEKNCFNCLKSKLKEGTIKTVVFSQYGDDVKICKDVKVDSPIVKQ